MANALFTLTESGVGNFDTVLIFAKGPDNFTNPALTTFSNATWSASNVTTKYAIATGDVVSILTMSVGILSGATSGSFDIFFMSGGAQGVLRDGETFPYIGNATGIPIRQGQLVLQADLAAVAPEPFSFSMVCLSLLGFIVIPKMLPAHFRRIRKKT